MTENLLQKLEEKMMMMLSEVEDLRNQVTRLTQENSSLKTEREGHSKKLGDLISLLDSVSGIEVVAPVVQTSNIAAINTAIMQDSIQLS